MFLVSLSCLPSSMDPLPTFAAKQGVALKSLGFILPLSINTSFKALYSHLGVRINSGGEWKVGVDFIHGGAPRLFFSSSFYSASLCVLLSHVLIRLTTGWWRIQTLLYQLFSYRQIKEKDHQLCKFLKKKTKSVYLPRFHVHAWAVTHISSSPNYEKQIWAMAQSMSIPLFSISLPANLFFPPKSLANIPSPCPSFVSTVPQLITPERKG